MDSTRRICEVGLRLEKAFMDIKDLFMSKINLELKKRIMRCFVWINRIF